MKAAKVAASATAVAHDKWRSQVEFEVENNEDVLTYICLVKAGEIENWIE